MPFGVDCYVLLVTGLWSAFGVIRKRIVYAIFMNRPEPHIGSLILEELQRQGKTTMWLSKQLGCSYRNVYKIYNRSWIQTDLLFQISNILNHNFFMDCANAIKDATD